MFSRRTPIATRISRHASAAAPAPDATSAIARAAGGCTDTDSNTADFSSIAAAPVNYLKLMPATYVVLVFVVGYMLLTVTADLVNPIRLFQ